jgi:hypothetical protein
MVRYTPPNTYSMSDAEKRLPFAGEIDHWRLKAQVEEEEEEEEEEEAVETGLVIREGNRPTSYLPHSIIAACEYRKILLAGILDKK